MTEPVTDRVVAEDEFPPTLREVMLRPRWIAMLVLCLVVASVFAWLLQWQLVRAINTDPVESGVTETTRPLTEIAPPGEYFDDSLGGQMVETTGEFMPGDFVVIGSRYNDQRLGYWVTGQLRVDDITPAASIPVALGWIEDRDAAYALRDELNAASEPIPADVHGRFIADEGPVLSADDPFEPQRMSPAQLLGMWQQIEVDGEQVDVWRAWIAADSPDVVGVEIALEPIASPAPVVAGPVNWLNMFYAIEWAIFAVFSFYLWYRLAKDAWERELEAIEGVDEDEA